MPLLTRLARVVEDYRAARLGVGVLSGASALSPVAVIAQDKAPPQQVAQSGGQFLPAGLSSIKPPMPLEPHCADIKLVFDAVEFKGEYRGRAYAWLASGCKGEVPVPEPGDNMKRFNASSRILQNGAKVLLTP
jgi:hypothetical protein